LKLLKFSFSSLDGSEPSKKALYHLSSTYECRHFLNKQITTPQLHFFLCSRPIFLCSDLFYTPKNTLSYSDYTAVPLPFCVVRGVNRLRLLFFVASSLPMR